MKRTSMLMIVILCISGISPCLAYGIGMTLDEWCVGIKEPEEQFAQFPPGFMNYCIFLPKGTDISYYQSPEEGEGHVQFWIYDPGNCTSRNNPGYSLFGPKWGFQSPLGVAFTVGISRQDNLYGCQGYSIWSSCAPTEYRWFNDGVRGAQDIDWTPGWYKWTLDGRWEEIYFTLHEVTYDSNPAPDVTEPVFGDVTRRYDALSEGGIWAGAFDEGWDAIYARGDDETGIEEVSLEVISSDGIFQGLCGFIDKKAVINPKAAAKTCTFTPSIISVPPGTVLVGEEYAYQVVVYDSTTPVTVSVQCSTAAIQFDSMQNIITWEPEAADTGMHMVLVYAMQDTVPVDWQSFSIKVYTHIGIGDDPMLSTGTNMGNNIWYDLRGRVIHTMDRRGIYLEVDKKGNVRKRIW